MELSGEFKIDASRQSVWDALNDPGMLQKCIPGCESIEQVGDNEFNAVVVAAIGPVKARFNSGIALENLNPPSSYTLTGQSKAGAAGFGRGSADVSLEENDGGTRLTYTANFSVGGKLAQVGSRLVEGATRKIAEEFFGRLADELGDREVPAEMPYPKPDSGMSKRTWIGIGAAVLVLLIWWFLLR